MQLVVAAVLCEEVLLGSISVGRQAGCWIVAVFCCK